MTVARALQLPDRRPGHGAGGGARDEPVPRAHRLARLGGGLPRGQAARPGPAGRARRRASTRATSDWRPPVRRSRSRRFGVPDGWDVLAEGIALKGELVVASAELPLRGEHNALNLCAALTALEALGIAPPALPGSLSGFGPLPHRLETVAERDGVMWVDDSISTTPESTLAALASFPGREHRPHRRRPGQGPGLRAARPCTGRSGRERDRGALHRPAPARRCARRGCAGHARDRGSRHAGGGHARPQLWVGRAP